MPVTRLILALLFCACFLLTGCDVLQQAIAPPGHVEIVIDADGNEVEVPVADGNSPAVDAFAPLSAAAGPYGTAITGGLLLLQNLFLARKKFSRKGQENQVAKVLTSDLGRALVQYATSGEKIDPDTLVKQLETPEGRAKLEAIINQISPPSATS